MKRKSTRWLGVAGALGGVSVLCVMTVCVTAEPVLRPDVLREAPGTLLPLVEAPVAASADATDLVAAPVVVPAVKPSDGVQGASTNKPQETTITSERIEFDYKEFVAVFDENVKVDNPQFQLSADRVVVFLDRTNQVSQIMALGRVTLTNEQRSASCDKAVYTRQNGQVVMTGSASLRRAGDKVYGDRIVIWLDDERMEVSPGHFVIAPATLRPRPKHAPVQTNATEHSRNE